MCDCFIMFYKRRVVGGIVGVTFFCCRATCGTATSTCWCWSHWTRQPLRKWHSRSGSTTKCRVCSVLWEKIIPDDFVVLYIADSCWFNGMTWNDNVWLHAAYLWRHLSKASSQLMAWRAALPCALLFQQPCQSMACINQNELDCTASPRKAMSTSAGRTICRMSA